MPNSNKLTAEEAVIRMKVAEGVYFLNAGFEKRMSTISQQMRAISLIGTLLDIGDPESGFKINKKEPIAIIGAGVAGITAAVLAAWRGCEFVHVFEKTSKVAGTFEESQRLIHPRLYEWGVEKDWNLDTAAIPLLDWWERSGKEVTKLIREQWDYWLDYYGNKDSAARRIYFHENVEFDEKTLFKDFDLLRGNLDSEFRFLYKPEISDNGVKFKTEVVGFKTIILATGFGQRTRPKWISENTKLLDDKRNAYIYDYWSEIPEICKGEKIAVIGGNDSGLTEAIELAVEIIKIDGKVEIKIDGKYEQLKQDNLPLLLDLIKDDEEEIRCRFNEIKENYANEIKKIENKEERKELEKEERKKLEKEEKIELEYKFYEQIRKIKSCELKNLIDNEKLINSHHITLFTRNKNKDNKPYLLLSSFPLNLFLISHFIDAGWITLKYCENAHETKINENGKFVIPESGEVFDHVLFRLGTEKEKGVENLSKIFTDKLKTSGFEHSSHNITLDIARKDPDKNETGKWLFASDLFDSFTQRQVFNELLIDNKIEDAEKELVNLYEKRLYLEILRRGNIVFVDTQILDGCFFLRWLNDKFSNFNEDEKKFLSERIIIKMRGKDTANNTDKAKSCLYEYGFTNKIYKFFRFSYLSDKSADMLDTFNPSEISEILEDIVNECFEKFPEKLTFKMWNDYKINKIEEHEDDEEEGKNLSNNAEDEFNSKKNKLIEEWKAFLKLHKMLDENKVLDAFKIKHFPNAEDKPWDPYSAFEDPALFAMSFREDKNALEVLRKMFRKIKKDEKDEKGKAPNRTEVFNFVDLQFPDTSDLQNQQLKNYFSRAYYRTVARQHGANIFETVDVSESCFPEKNSISAEDKIKNLWKYTYKNGDEPHLEPEEKEFKKDIDFVKELIKIFDTDDYNKSRKEQHIIKLASTNNESNSLPENVGQRALAVLRGNNVKIKRLWVEEASKAGAQIPAVVDEESLDNKTLNRVEYIYDLPHK